MLRFANGLSALVQVDTYCLSPLPRWHISGDAGTLVVDDFSCGGSITRVKESIQNWEPGIVRTAAGPTRTLAPRPIESVEKLPLPEAVSNETGFYRNIASVISGESSLIVRPDECLRVMNVIDAAFLSEKKRIAVGCHI